MQTEDGTIGYVQDILVHVSGDESKTVLHYRHGRLRRSEERENEAPTPDPCGVSAASP
jgi:hypothetical protein